MAKALQKRAAPRGPRARRDQALPGALRAALGAEALDRLEAVDRLDQDAVAAGRVALAGPGRPAERQLQQQPDRQHERHGDRRDQRDPAAEQPDRAR